jgi:SAM-dependent methyltransferase
LTWVVETAYLRNSSSISGCQVVAVDSSAPQIEAARKRGLDAHVMDGEALQFSNEFDAVFSSAVLHWIKRADPMIASVYRSLRSGAPRCRMWRPMAAWSKSGRHWFKPCTGAESMAKLGCRGIFPLRATMQRGWSERGSASTALH